MTRINYIYRIIALVMMWGIMFLIIFATHPSKPFLKLKPGQVWEYTLHRDNPFEEPIVKTNVVLEVQGDYVKYYYVERGITKTSTCEYFKLGSKLIKPEINYDTIK